MSILLMLIMVKIEHRTVSVDKVTLIEINHYYDGKGGLVFDQIIFYDWIPRKRKFEVVAWRMLKEPCQVPRLINGKWVSIWYDGDKFRKVISDLKPRETWSNFDPELEERTYLAKDLRKGLSK